MKTLFLAAVLSAVALCGGGCSTAPSPQGDPRNPEIFRPVNPQYPMPER